MGVTLEGHNEQPERAPETHCHILSCKVPFVRSVKATWSELRHLGAERLSRNVAFREKKLSNSSFFLFRAAYSLLKLNDIPKGRNKNVRHLRS